MELFKAVEKEMKTKAYSKEGLSQNAKQDPKEKERDELCDFLIEQLDEITRFLETIEAEEETLQVAVKKNKRDTGKNDRLSEIQVITERFKWHEGKLQLLLRSLQNGGVDNQQVLDIKDDIEYVMKEGKEADFDAENDEMYDDCNLDSEEAQFGLPNELDRLSSQDAQSVQDDNDTDVQGLKKTKSEPTATRRPSTQLKSPLPVLATLNTMPPPPTIPKDANMKPAPIPMRPAGETLKYASAAAAATAGDKSGVGVAPLPPPPGTSPTPALAPLPAHSKSSNTASPASISAQPVEKSTPSVSASVDESVNQDRTNHSIPSKSPTLSQTSIPVVSVPSSVPPTPAMETVNVAPEPVIADEMSITNGEVFEEPASEESIYHLPSGLQDLIQSFEVTKSRVSLQPSPSVQRLLQASQDSCPEAPDAERPSHYKPSFRYNTPSHYPQEPLPIFDDPSLYETGRIDTDTLFYIFYYRQGTYQQYLAAKSLKNQSWRFHKQYQTWFQRHEEPKLITEEFEQGTYRFFDYESTWSANSMSL